MVKKQFTEKQLIYMARIRLKALKKLDREPDPQVIELADKSLNEKFNVKNILLLKPKETFD